MIQQSRRLISRMAETVRRHRITVRETTVHHPQVRMTTVLPAVPLPAMKETVHLHRLSK
ncbi:MAG: hypothetical protein IKQ61_00050 [Spirochaetales bacterium]|nr:hypothetical protein [Spirochaetales bacterium]